MESDVVQKSAYIFLANYVGVWACKDLLFKKMALLNINALEFHLVAKKQYWHYLFLSVTNKWETDINRDSPLLLSDSEDEETAPIQA